MPLMACCFVYGSGWLRQHGKDRGMGGEAAIWEIGSTVRDAEKARCHGVLTNNDL